MKALRHILTFTLLIVFTSSFVDPYYHSYIPVFMLRDDMENNVRLVDPKLILEPGKIYIKDHLIFINEKYRGIHVIDNTNPEDPTNFAFINIDGCIDMSIKKDVLYADNAVDLIAIRLDPDMSAIRVTKRIKNVFPEMIAPDGDGLNWKEEQAKPKGSILVRWEKN